MKPKRTKIHFQIQSRPSCPSPLLVCKFVVSIKGGGENILSVVVCQPTYRVGTPFLSCLDFAQMIGVGHPRLQLCLRGMAVSSWFGFRMRSLQTHARRGNDKERLAQHMGVNCADWRSAIATLGPDECKQIVGPSEKPCRVRASKRLVARLSRLANRNNFTQ